jgi:hypothetical protein
MARRMQGRFAGGPAEPARNINAHCMVPTTFVVNLPEVDLRMRSARKCCPGWDELEPSLLVRMCTPSMFASACIYPWRENAPTLPPSDATALVNLSARTTPGLVNSRASLPQVRPPFSTDLPYALMSSPF